MNIKRLTTADVGILEQYLAPYQAECMFICSNIKAGGMEYAGQDFQGEYFGCFRGSSEDLDGVLVHYWNGNIMMYASDTQVLEQLVVFFKTYATRPVVGVLGPDRQAEYVVNSLGLQHAAFASNRNEGLYELDLKDLGAIKLPNDVAVVSMQDVSMDLLLQWRRAYAIEALGADNDSALEKRVAEEVDRQIRGQDCWVLLAGGVPVSLSGFNARLAEVVQVGPVWTPPEYRNQGFARLLLAWVLAQEKTKGTKKAILFTDTPAGIKAYRAIGFEKIGEYRLALLKKPVHLAAPAA